MKVKLITITAILLFSIAPAQSQVSIGALGGVNFQNMNGKYEDGDKYENGLMTGFHVGVNVNIPIATDFWLQPGLLFSVKGSNNDLYIPLKATDDYNTKTKISYIELPLNVLFRPEFANGHILLGFGPYIAYGVAGTETTELGGLPDLVRKIKFTGEVTDEDNILENAFYRPFDAGANIFAGYEFGFGFFFQVNAQLGLLNMFPVYYDDTESDEYLKNTGFGLSVGYHF